LTHKDLHLHVVQLPLMASEASQLGSAWFAAKDWVGLGLPAPIRKLLQA